MVYRGLVRGGVVVIEGDVALPEGTAVMIEAAVAAVVAAAVTPVDPPGRSAEGDYAEKVDRLLGGIGQSTAEYMKAQQRVDRYL